MPQEHKAEDYSVDFLRATQLAESQLPSTVISSIMHTVLDPLSPFQPPCFHI